MAKQNINSKKGFTIIEVVLVLAIAGLIFLMVFVALPALQRSQRDTQRRNDLSRVDTSLTQYQTNHTTGSNVTSLPGSGTWIGSESFGTCSGTACEFVRQYMNSGSGNTTTNTFTDPDGTPYSLLITSNFYNKDAITPLTISGTKSKLDAKTSESGNPGYTIVDNGGNAFDSHVIYIIPGGTCEGDVVVSSTERHYAILYRLEGAGVYCMDDQ